MFRRISAVLASAVVVVAAAACSTGDGGRSAVATTAGWSAFPVALDFDAPTVDGGRFDARDFAGQTLALWFWAPY